jgi:hypothetical protein
VTITLSLSLRSDGFELGFEEEEVGTAVIVDVLGGQCYIDQAEVGR